ncbi:MAG: DUF1574 family protein [Candidatus Melainabacteria bacterium]|nr:DUF1574 family protein [Candidatus Melainabacteria bacterium]
MAEQKISRRIVSTACLAAVLVAAIDLTFAFTHPLASINTVNTDKAEPYNAVTAVKRAMQQDALEQEQKRMTSGATASGVSRPVLLLGSSLVVAPALQCEAIYTGKEFKRFHQRRLTSFENYLESSLVKETGPNYGSKPVASSVRSYCLAMGGQMASDALLVAKEVLPASSDTNAGTSIVYGIAPRDFQDNLFPRIDASPIFRIFAQASDLPQLFESEPAMTAVDRTSAIGERISSLYRYRTDWQNLFAIRAKRTIEKCLPFVVFDKYYDTLALKPQKKGLLPGEAIGTPLVVPNSAVDHADWQTTAEEYRRRYNPVKVARAEAQFNYFEKLLHLCQERKVNLMVVNMPLSQDNMKALPKGFYKQYLSRADQLCAQYGVEFVDLNQGVWTSNSNYVDSVHLKPENSKAFMQKLAQLTAASNLSLALKRSPGSL